MQLLAWSGNRRAGKTNLRAWDGDRGCSRRGEMKTYRLNFAIDLATLRAKSQCQSDLGFCFPGEKRGTRAVDRAGGCGKRSGIKYLQRVEG